VTYPVGPAPCWVIESPRKTTVSPSFNSAVALAPIAINVAIVISILVPGIRDFSCEVGKTAPTHHVPEVGRADRNRQLKALHGDVASILSQCAGMIGSFVATERLQCFVSTCRDGDIEINQHRQGATLVSDSLLCGNEYSSGSLFSETFQFASMCPPF
jgi:hypothetical protein